MTFEAIQLNVPFERDVAAVGDRPQLYPLARLDDRIGEDVVGTRRLFFPK